MLERFFLIFLIIQVIDGSGPHSNLQVVHSTFSDHPRETLGVSVQVSPEQNGNSLTTIHLCHREGRKCSNGERRGTAWGSPDLRFNSILATDLLHVLDFSKPQLSHL